MRTISKLFVALFLCTVAVTAQIGVVELAGDLDSPVGAVNAGDGSGRLFIVGQEGVLQIWDGSQILPTDFLNIVDRVKRSSEQGLLGLAFHPDYANNGFFYVNYTNNSGDTRISRFTVSTGDPNIADPDSEMILMTIAQPFSNHNGGDIHFGPDGFLYIGTGDGGSGGDPGNRAQNLGELLGKLLRIDVDGDLPYDIPADNPFVDDPTARDEIWAYGMRNPWRFAFDRQTGDLLIGDVGQDEIEEIDFQPMASAGGENYGWRLMEGSQCFNPPNNCDDGSLILPILEYAHFDGGFQGCAVIGGRRYRGHDFPLLDGLYFYSDNCTGKIWAGLENGGTWTSQELIDTTIAVTSFGEDEAANLYLVGSSKLYRLVGTDPFCDIALDAPTYGTGDTLTLSEARVVNLGGQAVTARFQLEVQPAAGAPFVLVDKGADGSLQLLAGLETDFGPIDLITVPAGAPRGDYEMVCRLSDPVTAEVLAEQRVPFVLE